MWSWLANPWMLGLGGFAVSLPILIHLLNKRRFKIVQWAAMDFLFDAEKKNRRRVRLENFILLLLRCLAMLLIGLLLSRPFLPSSIAQALAQKLKYERVILIDDSLSQNVISGTLPAIEVAKKSVVELITALADSEETDDWLTLMLTSDPVQPLLSNEPLTRTTLTTLVQTIEQIECSDGAADYGASFNELNRYVSGERENTNRVTYLYSDMREKDWRDPGDESAPGKVLEEIAEKAVGSFVIDVGSKRDDNLAITSIRPEDLQVADKVIRFNVDVTNFGSQTVSDVRVLLQINDEAPEYETLPSIAPGQTEQVAIRYLFNRMTAETAGVEDESSLPAFQNFRLKAEIDRQSMTEEELATDQLIDDSSGFYAARVLNGVSVLLVDGDPSSVSERSETHYLSSLAVLGTGLQMDSVTVTDFETVSLSSYRVIFLCNVDEASSDRLRSLKQWVSDGGALVLMPGNRVQATTFNESFYQSGEGLSPVSLVTMEGDPTMSRWVNFEIDAQVHKAFELIMGADETSLSNVDVFSWWTSSYDEDKIDKEFSVPLRLSDRDNSVAMVDRTLGRGNVVVFTIPADGDWSMWPSSATYAPVMIDLIDYLVGLESDVSSLPIGGQIQYPVDLSVYQSRISLVDPENEKTEAIAKPVGDTEEAKSSELYRVEFEAVSKRGFYEVGLKRHSGETERVLFASNVDAREGQLKRIPDSVLESQFLGDKIKLVTSEELAGQTIRGGELEIWPLLLMLLFGVLVLEQFLGWWFGRKR